MSQQGGGGTIILVRGITPITHGGKTLNVNNTKDSDVSFDESVVFSLVDTLGDADGNSVMTI